jgi:hypothetical protein
VGDLHLIGGNVPFGKSAGELRWIHDTAGGTTILQADVNGDGKADFSIALLGTHNFVDGDFQL